MTSETEKSIPTEAHNLAAESVSDVTRRLKRTVEGAFDRVRIRGEISGFKRAASGHLYFALKDTDAVMDAVCWRGQAGRLSVSPEEGLEVIATGRLTVYGQRSKYQIVIEQLEIAGEGALLKLLEERRRKLAAEGLFEEERKRPLPYLPDVIGVVTSPTGAVIRDILHRLADRFPRRVLVWPVLVQGEGAAEQVTAAIEGFGRLPVDGPVPRPDLIIVARGGGSLEDLWSFNEESVVRAAAASPVPLISAVGHETDWTLIDFAADRRAPTPTAAAEMAVPVRSDLLAMMGDLGGRLTGSVTRYLRQQMIQLEGWARGLGDPKRVMEARWQRLDDRGERLAAAPGRLIERRSSQLLRLAGRLVRPGDRLGAAQGQLTITSTRLSHAWRQHLGREQARLGPIAARHGAIRPERLLVQAQHQLESIGVRGEASARRRLREEKRQLTGLVARLEAGSHKAILARGYILARDEDGRALPDRAAALAAGRITLEFRDGAAEAVLGGSSQPRPGKPKSAPGKQGQLF